jgi:Mrp family chromosome partitioning ATPase
MKVDIPATNRLYQGLKDAIPFRGARPAEAAEEGTPEAAREPFRLLALNLRVLLPKTASPGVVVLSAHPRDGRSYVAANLALALSEDSPVLLVDEQAGSAGNLGDLVRSGNGVRPHTEPPPDLPVLSTRHSRLWLWNAPVNRDGENGLSQIVSDAGSRGLFTVVDSSPALTSSSAFLAAQQVGQVVYVVRKRPQDMEQHRRVREQLNRLGIEIVGLVVNEA